MEAEEAPSVSRVRASADESSAPPPSKRPRIPAVTIGSLVRKSFPADAVGEPPRPLLGKVLSCCGRQYTIVFEDGRREALNLPETRQILLARGAEADPESMRRLDDICRSVPVNAPRTRSRRNDPEAVDPAGVAASSSSVRSSHLDDGADSCSDSCDSVMTPLSLPPSSGDVQVPEDAVPHLFNVYNFLRSFSHQLFLSPFGFDEFVSALNCTARNSLLDAVHLSLLRTLRRHLQALELDGSKLACTCLKYIDWDLLDVLTWPIFLVRYFHLVGHMKELDKEVFLAGALEEEYYGLPVILKLSVLQILCDDVLESSELLTELATRENMDEEKEIDANTNVALLEGGPKRVHPRYAKTSACQNPGSLEETIVADEPVSSPKHSGNDSKNSSIGQDGNSDDCRLCAMEGTLVCCDGCPSAYHSRCIGLNKASLPDGPWFCPECIVKKMGPTSSRVSFGIRGAELFGSDPFGRMFLGSCDYLLVLDDAFKGKQMPRYYNRNDIIKVLQVLCSTVETFSLYADISKAISIYFEFPLPLDHSQHLKSEDASLTVIKDVPVRYGNDHTSVDRGEEEQVGEINTCNGAEREPPPHDDGCLITSITNDASVMMDTSSLGAESIFESLSLERRLEGLEDKDLIVQQKAFEDTNIVLPSDYQLRDESSKSAGESNRLGDVTADHSRGKGHEIKNGATFKPHEYINHYIPGEVAASAAANFAIAAAERNKILETNTPAKDRKNLPSMYSLQLKSFSEASMHFLWPGNDKMIMDVLRERCGWCLACETAATSKKGCLLNLAIMNTLRGYSRSLGNFRPLKNESHTSSIAAYVLYMEASLNGLLEGPFLDAYHNVQWRKAVAEISTIRVLKYLVLEFEKNIRRIAFSNDWRKPLDDWSSEVSVSQNSSCASASSQKRSLRGRRGRKRIALPEHNPSDSDDDPRQIQWWYGGKLSDVVLKRGTLPAVLVKKAARQGGAKELTCVIYNLNLPSATREATWRASVEKSKNHAQLAFQVRYLDAHLRWRDLYRPELTSLDGKVVDTEISAFRNANITDEKVVGNYTRYALAFSDQKHLPSRIVKNALETEQCVFGDKLWFSENFVPLYLIKEYEEMKKQSLSCLPSSLNKEANWLAIIPSTKCDNGSGDIFSYLFVRGEKSMKSSCSSCKRDVVLRHAFKCESCGGPCHRQCLKASAMDIKKCLCTVCYNVNPMKKDSVVKLKIRMPASKCQVPQHDGITPEAKIRGQSSSTSSEQSVIIEKSYERRSDSANMDPKKKSQCLTNGLIFKERKGLVIESCDPDFRTKNIILKGDVEMGTRVAPKCKLCTLPYNPNLMYVRCEKCKFWYHADSVQLQEGDIYRLMGFKCPTCRRRCSPTCPYADPNVKRKHKKRNDMDAKQCLSKQIVQRTSSEPPEYASTMQSAQVKIEDVIVPPERVDRASFLISEAPGDWSPSRTVLNVKGKLPVRRLTSNDISTDVDLGHSVFLEEHQASEINQEVDLQGFSSIQEADSTVGVNGMHFLEVDHDFTTDGVMDAREFNGSYQMFDSNVGADDMEYEPQTYFSFTELLASDNEQVGEMFDVDIPVEVPDDWQPPWDHPVDTPNGWDPIDPSAAGDNYDVPQGVPPGCSAKTEENDGLECQKCSSNEPPPDLFCVICGLTIHSHCSPWVEVEQQDGNTQWRCGSCREWR